MFGTARPVTATAFFNRHQELERLASIIEQLPRGTPTWAAIVGPRKIGKTSLVLESARRTSSSDIVFVVVDAEEAGPLSLEFFRRYAIRAVDALLGSDLDVSLEIICSSPDAYRSALLESDLFLALKRDVRTLVLGLVDRRLDASVVRDCLEVPELMARELGKFAVVAIDEFQELTSLASKRGGFDPLPLLRSVWQKQRHTAYVVSGSGRSMLLEMITSKHSPFFQHFDLMLLDRFQHDDAIELLCALSPPKRRISKRAARTLVDVVGGHPYYLQLLGASLIEHDPPYDDASVKRVLQDQLFSRSGRLSLYFKNQLDRIVGNSSYLAAVLEAAAESPGRLTDLAEKIGARASDTARYIERVGDAIVRRDDDTYALDDPTFALWLRWRRPGGSAIPMTLLGDAAERDAALYLARLGFDLVYQSLASRGAFDLLATRGAKQLGVQVKRSTLPVRLKKSETARMEADAKRFGWKWIIVAVSPDGSITALDPARARRGREVRFADESAIENLLAWL